MSSYLRTKHDIAITNVGTDGAGTTLVGMMLHKDKGVPVWQDFDGKALADQFFTGVPSQDYTDPEQEILLSQSDWRSGFGRYISDPADPKRYFSVAGMDLRWENMAILSNGVTAVTIPAATAPTVTDGGMEIWTDANTLTNWTKAGAGTLNREAGAGNFHGGTYSANTVGAVTIAQTVTWAAAYQGRRITFTCWCKSDTASTARISIYDGVNYTYSSYHTGGGTFEQLTVTAVLAVDATELTFTCHHPAGAAVTYYDDAAFSGTTPGVIKAFVEFNGGLYIGQGAILAKLNNAGTAFTAVYECPAAITDLEPFTDNALYIAQGLSNAYYYMDALSLENCDAVWTESVDTDVTATVSVTDFKQGSASLTLTVAAGAAANDILATQAISSTDLTTYSRVGMWVKSSVTLSAGDLRFLLDDTALCASPLKTLNVPAVAANTWTWVDMSLGTASGLGAIISLGIEMEVDKGAFTLQIDDIRAFKFTISTTTVKNYKFFKTVHSASPTLWGSDSNYTIRSNATPKADTWSGQTTVGSSYYSITALIQKSGALYIMKEDMPYYLSAAGAVQNSLAPELAACTSSTSGKNVKLWKSKLYIPAGAQALLRTDGTTNEFINPGDYCTVSPDFSGQVQGVAYDEQWLFVATDYGAYIELLAGRDEEIDGVTAWRWHPLKEITLTGAECMFVSTIYQKRLWIASTSASDSLYYMRLPTTYGNILSDANRAFATGGAFVTSYLHGNFKNNLKSCIKITATLGHAYDAGIYFTVAYMKIGDSTFTTIGNLVGTASNRSPSLYIPADGSGVNPITTMIALRFIGVTNDTTKTPVLNQFTIKAILYPEIKTLHYCQVDCREDMVCKDGTPDKNMYDTIITTLDNARNATWPVSIRDINGTTKYVKFLPLPRNIQRWVVTKDEKGREIERIYSLLMEEVTLS